MKSDKSDRKVVAALVESERMVTRALRMPVKTRRTKKEKFLDSLIAALIPAGALMMDDESAGASNDKQRAAFGKLAQKFDTDLLRMINSRLFHRVGVTLRAEALVDIKTDDQFKRLVAQLIDLWAVTCAFLALSQDDNIVAGDPTQNAFMRQSVRIIATIKDILDDLLEDESNAKFSKRFKRTKLYRRIPKSDEIEVDLGFDPHSG